MDNILKFNNKYLKCIVTKYLSAPERVLANSGALIIYQPEHEKAVHNTNTINGVQSNEYNRNYIYLGDEFLASGYGFLCKDIREKAEEIVSEYDSTIQQLHTDDANEASIRDRNDKKILEELKKYVAINGGVINNTNIVIDGNKILTKDIILYGEEAKYNNLEVTNIKISINDKFTISNDNNIYVPIGLKINKIQVDIDYDINDSGGVKQLSVVHKNIYENTSEENNEQLVLINYDQDYSNTTEGHIRYVKRFDANENQLYVTEKIEDIISGIYLSIKETPVDKYKNYPGLEYALNIKIKSIGNAIKDNKMLIAKNINIVPQYFLYYQYNELLRNNIENTSDLRVELIDYNDEFHECKIYLNSNLNYKEFYIAIPSQYQVIDLTAINTSGESFNWTGFTQYYTDVNLYAYRSNVNSIDSYYTVNFNVYELKCGSKFNSGVINNIVFNNINYIKLTLLNTKYNLNAYNNISDSFSNISNNANAMILSKYTNGSSLSINNENFNSLYWLTFKGNENYYLDVKNSLDKVKENGLTS